MKTFKALLALSLLPVIVLAGCSSVPGKEDLKSSVLEYSIAVQNKNWDEVCNLISIQSQQSVVDNSGQLTCSKGYNALSKKDQMILQNSAKDATFVSSEIDGEKATVTIKTANGTAKVPVIVENGVWKVHLFK